MSDYILLTFYNSVQNIGDVSPESCDTHAQKGLLPPSVPNFSAALLAVVTLW
jgi:hypothetical protein